MKGDEKNTYKFDEAEKLSDTELEEYIDKLTYELIDNPTDKQLYTYLTDLYEFWIKKNVNIKTAYGKYIWMLNLTNRYYEAYDVCQRLLKQNKYKSMVYEQLTDFGYVVDGVFSFKEYINYMKKAIDVCEDIQKKEELIDLLEYFMNPK